MFGLAACGGNATTESQEPSQEEMLEQAEELDLEAFHEMDSENEAKAKQEYDGKIFRCTAIVGDINPTYVRVGQVILGQLCNTPRRADSPPAVLRCLRRAASRREIILSINPRAG